MARKTGTSMNIDYSNPRLRRRAARRRHREEKSWAAQSGPVKIYFRRPPQEVDLQSEYDAHGAAGDASPIKPAA